MSITANGLARTCPSSAPLPAGAIECHCHVFDPAQFPFAEPRSYTPGMATLDDLRAFHTALGVSRTVLIQPSVYGTDNRCLIDALSRLGPIAARGVAVIDPAVVSNADLRALQGAGVVGVRVNLNAKGESRGAAAVDALQQAINRVASLGFVVQVYVDLALLEALASTIAASPVPIVLDHFGGAQASLGLDQPGFAALRQSLATGKAWVKLSAPYRASTESPDYQDLAPIARALIEARPDRLVWASDWPHTGGTGQRGSRALGDIEPFQVVDDARNAALLQSWIGNAENSRDIFVENAARLFRF